MIPLFSSSRSAWEVQDHPAQPVLVVEAEASLPEHSLLPNPSKFILDKLWCFRRVGVPAREGGCFSITWGGDSAPHQC